MTHLGFGRYTFGLVLAIAMLAGCGGSQPLLATPQRASQTAPSVPAATMGIMPTRNYSVLKNFRLSTGASPTTLTMVGKTFFGTTPVGGNKTCDCGVVYALSPSGAGYKYAILHEFTGGTSDGDAPVGPLNVSSSGVLYGATGAGGGSGCSSSGYVGCGTIFKLTPSASGYDYKILYRFKGGNDGAGPQLADSGSVSDAGPFFGTTGSGGESCQCGTVFKVVRSGTRYSNHVLWSFNGRTDGKNPSVAVRIDGRLYGTAQGGTHNSGAVWRMDAGRLTLLHVFHGADGARPRGLLATDASGNLYGAADGGVNICQLHIIQCGLIYELSPRGNQYIARTLHDFSPGFDGWNLGNVLRYEDGVLYGTTVFGGKKCGRGASRCGTVFALSASTGKEKVVYRFSDGSLGFDPWDILVGSSGSILYGTAQLGGHADAGVIYRLTI
jgi:uncharacterized repeat protein (TIGR03803 family)